ncbi:MAG: hypothetical protein F4090_01825 [Nitrospira sp. SB0672_bin_25]|nr:hypothetical protein [Nitrospira sp. SB0666_bin_27]MYC26855.1 hypothetical protein [Nitrospira sp. SB0662_bin_26]MYF25618.1 hypothetical protein [Nitrospira sp. SB0678_bin_10]MYJ53649.1 hypothetical protein [Nitrospira sp. SB0672_bin_25]
MIQALAIPIILFSMFVAIPQVDAACTTNKIGKTSFTNCTDGSSSFSVQSGQNTFSTFNDGSSSVTNSFGNTSVSSSNQPGLGGTSLSINEDTGVSQWNDGTTGVHQNFGNVRVDTYNDGTICTTAPVGSSSFTNCRGDSKDAPKRSAIIGTK